MLSQQSIVAAGALASDLAVRSLTLNAKPNTIVYELNRATNAASLDSVAIPDIGNWEQFDSNAFGGFIEHITHNYDNPTDHDKSIDAFTSDLRKAVLGHISFAKNIVKPVVLEFAEKLNSSIQTTVFPSAEDQFTINVFDIPDVMNDVVFRESLKDYGTSVPYSGPEADLSIKSFEGVNLLEYILTGDSEVDKDITQWYSNTGAGEFYTQLIQDVTTRSVERKETSLFKQTNKMLFGYLLNKALHDKGDMFAEDTKLNAVQTKNIVAVYRNYCGVSLVKLIEYIELISKSGVLVIEAITSSKEVTVLGDTYRKWLKEGGSTEVIYAVLLSNNNPKTVKQVDALKETLAKEWNSYKIFWENSQSNARLDILKNNTKLLFRDLLKDLADEEKDYINTHSDYYTTADKILDKVVDTLKLSDLSDVYGVSLKIVCNARFYYTDSEFILSEMVEVAKNNPDIKPEEAALIATIHYLVDYLCDQLYVTDKV